MEHSEELRELRKELEMVKKEFNDYKIHVQLKALPEAEAFKYMVKDVKKELENVQYLNDALLNFIAENGLGEKYYNQFVTEDYPYDMLDFIGKNEVAYSEFEVEQFLGTVRYQITKIACQN